MENMDWLSRIAPWLKDRLAGAGGVPQGGWPFFGNAEQSPATPASTGMPPSGSGRPFANPGFTPPQGGMMRGYAEGGRPPEGEPAVVGEDGPEVFVPDQPGTVVPNWLASALARMPPQQPEMTRALPNYEQRDPRELAAMRLSESVRPQAGRKDFPMSHLANMATAATALSPIGAGRIATAVLAPEFAAGRAIAAGTHLAAQHAPKLTTAALAGGASLAPSGTEGAEDKEGIMQLQRQLRDAGFYTGKDAPIDGNYGPATKRAKEAYDKAEQEKRASEIKSRELAAAEGANTATLETARANQKAAEAKAAEVKAAAEKDEAERNRKEAADARMRDIDKNLPWYSKVMRDYSGPAGMLAGALLGSGARYVTQSKADKAIKETATAGNAIMAEDVAAGKQGVDAALAKAAQANAFWERGGAKGVPFLLESAKAPGISVNPKAAPLSNTYNPQIHPAVELAAAAPAGIEFGTATYYKDQWEKELHEAEKALAQDTSEANIQRLNKAKDNVGLFTGLQRMGMVAGGVQGVGAVGNRFMPKGPGMRPDMRAPENTQMDVQKWLREYGTTAEKAAKAAATRQANAAKKAANPTPSLQEMAPSAPGPLPANTMRKFDNQGNPINRGESTPSLQELTAPEPIRAHVPRRTRKKAENG